MTKRELKELLEKNCISYDAKDLETYGFLSNYLIANQERDINDINIDIYQDLDYDIINELMDYLNINSSNTIAFDDMDGQCVFISNNDIDIVEIMNAHNRIEVYSCYETFRYAYIDTFNEMYNINGQGDLSNYIDYNSYIYDIEVENVILRTVEDKVIVLH